jgi:ABC-type transport system involved in multi-copper enzyme maturation permease subunit
LSARLIVLAPLALACLQLLIAALGESGAQTQQALLGASAAETANEGYGHWVDALVTGFTTLGLLSVALAAHSFAAERDLGTLRHSLIRRTSRSSLVLTKLIALHLLVCSAVLLLVFGSWGLSSLLWDLGPVVEDGYELISEAEILREIHLGLQLALLPLPAALAFGLLVSVAAQSGTQALTLALGATLGFDVFKTSLGDSAAFIYARFQPSLIDASYLGDVARLARGYSDVLVDERLLVLNTWAPLPAFIAFLALSLLIVQRKTL